MTGPADEELKALLQRLSEQLAGDELVILSKPEIETIRRMIKAWLTAEAMIVGFAFVKKVALWVVAIGAAYAAFKAGLLEFLGIQK